MSSMNWSIFWLAPVTSKMKLSLVVSMTWARKISDMRRLSTRASPFPAFNAAGGIGDVDHLHHGHEAEELLLDLLEHMVGAGGDDGDARLVSVAVDLGDRERLDVVAARGEQADDAGEDARLVVDDAGERALFHALVGVGHVVGGGGIFADAGLGGNAGAG